MRTLFWTTLVLGLCFTTPLHAQEGPPDPPVERQVIVMFETDAAALPNGATRAEIGQAQLPGQVKGLLQRAGARRLAKGFPDFRRADTLRVLENGRTYRVPDYTNLFVVTLPPNANRDSVVARLNRLPEWVQYAEKNQRPAPRLSPGSRSHTVSSQPQNVTDEVIPPNQDDFDKQWGLRNTSGPDIEATKAWNYTQGSSNVTIGVVDGGIDVNHVDLSGKVSGYTGTNDHSTAVAGVAAAKGDNPSGRIAGTDWDAQIHSEPQTSDLVGTAQSIDDAVTAGARIINNSWGFDDNSTTLTQALRSAYRADVLPVHANPYKNGTDAQKSSYPNNVGPWIVNVGAMNQSGAPWSNTGSRSFTDVAAPGVNIYTTLSNGSYDFLDGTSLSAPFVVGTASLLLSAEPSLRNYDIEHLLERTAQSYGSGRDPEVGYGMIDAHEAVKRVSDPYEVTHGTASFTKIRDDFKVDFLNGFTTENGTFYSAGKYVCDVYKLSASTSSPDFYYKEKPWFWLPVTEKGFSPANPNDGNRYLSKSVSKSSAEATTYFYYIESNVGGQEIGWVPFDPTVHKRNGSFEYTVIGEPETPPLETSISGPSSLNSQEFGTWTTSVSGGTGSVSYDWESKDPTIGSTWQDTQACSGSSCTIAFFNSGDYSQNAGIRTIVTKGTEIDTATANALIYPSGSGCGTPPCTFPSKAKPQVSLKTIQPPDQTPESAHLAWTVRGAVPTSAFTVQHRADSTGAWTTLGTVEAADSVRADTSAAPTYRYEATDLKVGTHQFRVGIAYAGKQAARTADTEGTPSAGDASTSETASQTRRETQFTSPVTAKVTLDGAYRLTAYPNPVRQQATIELAVQEQQDVTARVYDVLGRRVATLHEGPMPAQETRRLRFNARDAGLSSGSYFVRVRGEDFAATKRLTVVR